MRRTFEDIPMTHPDPYKLWIQLDTLKEKLWALARENAELRADRDIALAQVDSLLPKATPE